MKVVDEARVIMMAADKSNKLKKDTDYVHKGLEHALWNEVKDAEVLKEYGESLKNLRGNKAVEMMMKRRERMERYTIESEEKVEEEPLKGEEEPEPEEPEQVLEEIPVGALKGEIKLPPLNINPQNNSSLAKPFDANLVDPNNYGKNNWQRVPFSSTRLSGNLDNTDMETSFMSTGASSTVFYDQLNGNQNSIKGYKPIAFMNFKPKTKGLISNGASADPYLNDVLGAMERQQADLDKQKAAALEKQKLAEQEAALKRQKKQEAIDARLYTGVHRMSQISDWKKNAPSKHEDFWGAVKMSEQIQAAKQ